MFPAGQSVSDSFSYLEPWAPTALILPIVLYRTFTAALAFWHRRSCKFANSPWNAADVLKPTSSRMLPFLRCAGRAIFLESAFNTGLN